MTCSLQSIGRVGNAELWSVDLDAPEAPEGRDTLSAEERARAARFVFPRDRARYEAAHGALRRLLARHTGRAAESLCLVQGAFGKPRLAGYPAVEFNLSHSQGLALIAIGRTPLGVDVEMRRPFNDWRALAAAHFTEAEQSAIASQPADLQADAFLRCWTRKEACLKALGVGLSVEPRSIDVAMGRPEHRAAPVLAAGHGALTVQSFPIGRHAIAALAFVTAPAAADSPTDRMEACA